MTLNPLPQNHPTLDGYHRPKMMAIGDSQFNGTRSLTTDAVGANNSPPAQVAQQIGIDFKIPDYPRPILFDLEAVIRDVQSVDDMVDDAIKNAKDWQHTLALSTGPRFHDNLAVAGHTYQDLWEARSGTNRLNIPKLIDSLDDQALPLGALLKLYFAINNAFVLSPANDSDVNRLSPLEQVASRQPERLLVNIGANNGVFMTILMADNSQDMEEEIEQIPDHAVKLANYLVKYCNDVEHVYFSTLVRPRVVANLRPRDMDELGSPPIAGGYFKSYISDILNGGFLDAKAMERFDKKIERINLRVEHEIRRAFDGNTKTIPHFVDLFEIGNAFDTKHWNDRLIVQKIDDDLYRLGNFPYYGLSGRRRGTGLFSIDNMHPTIVGYNVVSNQIMRSINHNEGENYPLRPWPVSIEADTLVKSPPRLLDVYKLLVSIAKFFF